MDIYDNESEIIDTFRDEDHSEVCLIPEDDETERVYLSIHEHENRKYWVDSSGKGDPPPDFYSNHFNLMMEVMRVDDHGFIGEKGGIVNPTRALESKTAKELKDSGIMEHFPNAKLHMIVDTGLPTNQDHNYKFYRDGFLRAIESHKKKIDRYKANHPDCKVVFFVFDESSAYAEVSEIREHRRIGQQFSGRIHYWFADAAFLSSFRTSEIDYLIWYSPYKKIDLMDGQQVTLPRVVVYNIRKMDIDDIVYNEDFMMSVEV